MKHAILVIGCIFILLMACKTPQFSREAPPEEFVIFEEGGGVTAALKSWVMKPDGAVFKIVPMMDSAIYIGKIKRNNAQQLFKNLTTLSENTEEFTRPGNMYKRIKYTRGDTTIEWTYNAINKQENQLETVYNNFKKFLNSLQ